MSAHFKPIRQIKPAGYSSTPNISGNVIFPRLESYHHGAQPSLHQPGLESFKQEAAQHYDQGYAAGKREAEHASAATLAALQAALDQLTGSIGAIQSEIEQSYKDSVLLCLGHLMPDLSQHVLTAQMADIILQASQDECGDGLTASLHPDNSVARDYLTASIAAQNLNLTIAPDPNQGPMAVQFSWGESDIHLDPAATARACLDAIGALPLTKSSTSPNGETL